MTTTSYQRAVAASCGHSYSDVLPSGSHDGASDIQKTLAEIGKAQVDVSCQTQNSLSRNHPPVPCYCTKEYQLSDVVSGATCPNGRSHKQPIWKENAVFIHAFTMFTVDRSDQRTDDGSEIEKLENSVAAMLCPMLHFDQLVSADCAYHL